jgi:ribosomal protein L40E
MKVYSKDSICRKCGSDDISSFYKEEWPLYIKDAQEKTEYINRYCRNCHYEWKEATLDSKLKEVKY